MYKKFLIFALLLPLPVLAQLVDPTRPPDILIAAQQKEGKEEKAQPILPTLTLNAVINSRHRRIAVINGQIASIGDNIDGYLVQEILATQVKVKGPEGIQELQLITQQVKHPTKTN